MTNTHQQIYQHFLQKLGQTETEFFSTHSAMRELEYEGFCKYMFQNWTPSQPSFHLTNIGFVILSRMYQTWRFTLDQQPPNLFNTAKTCLFLRRHVTSPHYWDKKWFYLFNSELALELEMAAGDLSTWIEMFS